MKKNKKIQDILNGVDQSLLNKFLYDSASASSDAIHVRQVALLFRDTNPTAYYNLSKRGYELGHAPSTIAYAKALMTGEGCSVNHRAAIKVLQTTENPYAWALAAGLIGLGIGVSQDEEKASEMLNILIKKVANPAVSEEQASVDTETAVSEAEE